MKNKQQPIWSVPIRAEDVPETGQPFALVADEATRQAIAGLAGLRSLPRLEAHFDVARHGGGLRVTGQVSATVGQTCVVTLEPMTNEVEEAVDLIFAPQAGGAPADAQAPEDEREEGPEEGPEPLADGTLDLGALVTEFLLLGIDPYPRRPDAVFAPPRAEESPGGAFAALAALKKDRGAG
jgi:uncharacterized metal-binding protein YceD (DUF177 family)